VPSMLYAAIVAVSGLAPVSSVQPTRTDVRPYSAARRTIARSSPGLRRLVVLATGEG